MRCGVSQALLGHRALSNRTSKLFFYIRLGHRYPSSSQWRRNTVLRGACLRWPRRSAVSAAATAAGSTDAPTKAPPLAASTKCSAPHSAGASHKPGSINIICHALPLPPPAPPSNVVPPHRRTCARKFPVRDCVCACRLRRQRTQDDSDPGGATSPPAATRLRRPAHRSEAAATCTQVTATKIFDEDVRLWRRRRTWPSAQGRAYST